MNRRDAILAAINKNKPSYKPLPIVNHRQFVNETCVGEENLTDIFSKQLILNGGEIIELDGTAALQEFVVEKKRQNEHVINTVSHAGTADTIPSDLNALEKIQQVFIAGSVAVAENAAVWLEEDSMRSRILPFISEQLFIIISPRQLVRNMHEAYEKITIDRGGFGVFVAGPSKTADIEQSLVIGAHGPKKMTVLLVGGTS